MKVITSLLESSVDAVYSSDTYGVELARRLGARWVQVDPGRIKVPGVRMCGPRRSGGVLVGARAVRAFLVLPAGRGARRRVNGDDDLGKQLAEHYGTTWVREYGRTWSEIRPGGLSASWESWEFDHVAERQCAVEDSAAGTAPRALIICDTDVLATTVWHERYTGSTSPTVVALAESRQPDLYLLSDADVPFVQDGLRDGEHLRENMTMRFREVLAAQPSPWVEMSGSWDERFATAVSVINNLIDSP